MCRPPPIRDGEVFVVLDGRAVRAARQDRIDDGQGVRIERGLIGGEDLIVNPPRDFEGWRPGETESERS